MNTQLTRVTAHAILERALTWYAERPAARSIDLNIERFGMYAPGRCPRVWCYDYVHEEGFHLYTPHDAIPDLREKRRTRLLEELATLEAKDE